MNTEPKDDKPYEPPQIETVLTPEELAREILYAGDLPSRGQA